jgi:hypothetical protein
MNSWHAFELDRWLTVSGINLAKDKHDWNFKIPFSSNACMKEARKSR